jgi:hypothetical protein
MDKNIYLDSWKHGGLMPCVPGEKLDLETAKRSFADAIDRGEIPRVMFSENSTRAEIEQFATLARSRGKWLAPY